MEIIEDEILESFHGEIVEEVVDYKFERTGRGYRDLYKVKWYRYCALSVLITYPIG